ncbi:hypothetical protein ES707_18017 [subsurface metagenome]
MSQFNSCAVLRGKILHQRTEIDSFLRCEIKTNLVAVKLVLDIHKLHFEFMILYLLLTYFERLYLLLSIIHHYLHIGIGRKP